jgi:hypothetical protein
VDAVGTGRQSYVGAGVDEESGSQLSVLTSQLSNDLYGFAGQEFEVAGGKIFFAELDVIDTVGCGFGDFFEQTAAAGGLVAGECGAVGYVAEERAFSHQLSV